jgi:hypothetical protein
MWIHETFQWSTHIKCFILLLYLTFPLPRSQAKYDSGCGWPAFYAAEGDPLIKKSGRVEDEHDSVIQRIADPSIDGRPRVEVRCKKVRVFWLFILIYLYLFCSVTHILDMCLMMHRSGHRQASDTVSIACVWHSRRRAMRLLRRNRDWRFEIQIL